MPSTINASNSGSGGLISAGDASGVLALQTGGTTAITVDGSQNVGIGTTSPTAKLQLSAAGDVGGKITNTSTTGSGTWNITNNSGSLVQLMLYGSAQGAYGAIGSGEAAIYSSVSTTIMADNGSSVIKFATGGATERMRIDSSGNLLIGYTSSNGSYKLQVNSQIFATSSTIATSDARYKENVEELSGALDIVKSLRPVSFDWKVHPIHNFDTKTKTVGFLAQDVQQTLAGKPYLNSIIKTNECVIEPEVKDENGIVTKEAVTEEFLGIAESNMISILTAAIKELKAEFDAYVIAHP